MTAESDKEYKDEEEEVIKRAEMEARSKLAREQEAARAAAAATAAQVSRLAEAARRRDEPRPQGSGALTGPEALVAPSSAGGYRGLRELHDITVPVDGGDAADAPVERRPRGHAGHRPCTVPALANGWRPNPFSYVLAH